MSTPKYVTLGMIAKLSALITKRRQAEARDQMITLNNKINQQKWQRHLVDVKHET